LSNVPFFLWQLCHNSIHFCAIMKIRDIIASNVCHDSDYSSDDILHGLFLCGRALDVWHQCLGHVLQPFVGSKIKYWLKSSID